MSDFDSIFAAFMQELLEENRIEGLSKAFSSLESSESKLENVFALLLDENVIPLALGPAIKNNDESARLRGDGNSAFKRKEFLTALNLYTKSIAFALNGSLELALAYANRSAVHFSLKSDELCVIDINRAISCPYPVSLKYKLYERKAKCFLRNNCLSSFQRVLRLAIESLKKSSMEEEAKKRLEQSYLSDIKKCQENSDTTNVSKSLGKSIFSPSNEEATDPILSHNNETNLPKIPTEPNPVIPCASKAIKLKHSKEAGRCLFAMQDIYPGDVIVVEEPYASILLPDHYLSHCYACFKRTEGLVPCTHCSLVMYCSQNCRSQNWDKCHRSECAVLPSLLALKFDKMKLLAVRILIIATKQGTEINELREYVDSFSADEVTLMKGLNSNGQYISSDYNSVHFLETNTRSRSLSDLFRRTAVAAVIVHLLQEINFFKESEKENFAEQFNNSLNLNDQCNPFKLSDSELFCGALLMNYLQSLPCNAHEVSEMVFLQRTDNNQVSYESLEIGAVAYPVLSLINHSCDPNVVRHSYSGDVVVLRAIQAINAGDQLFDNYGYHHALQSRAERQEHLYHQYYFHCQCVACADNWPLYSELPSIDPIFISKDPELIKKVTISSSVFKEIFEKVLKMETCGHLDFLYKHLALLQRSIQRPWKEYSQCQETIKQCLSMEANHYIMKN